MRLPFLRPPILVCGTEPLAQQVLKALLLDGRRVERIDPGPLVTLDPRGFQILILADLPDAPNLVAAIIARREQARRTRRRSIQRLILMHPHDPPPVLPAPDPNSLLRIETFAIENRAARALLTRWPLHLGLDPKFGQRPHLLILGFEAPACAILVQALRMIQYGDSRPRVTVICDRSDEVAMEFLGAYPQAREVADIQFTPMEANALGLQLPGTDAPVTLAVVCLADAARQGLASAQALARDLTDCQGVSPPILLETGQPNGESSTRKAHINDWDGQIIPVSYLGEACRADVLLDGRGDEVARTIHDHYRDSIAAQGRDPNLEPAGQPWAQLATSYRQANRHQADHVWAKLAVTDARAVPEEMVESFVFTPLEVERLAIIEHERWAADRYLDGWRYAPVRDNQLKHHPQLIPYAELSEPMKDLDRFAVRGLPTLLARQGLGIMRLLIVGVPEPDPDCADGLRLQRLADQAIDRLSARYPDRVLVLATTLLDRRSRALVKQAMDRKPDIGLFLLLPRPLSRTLADLPDQHTRGAFLALVARAQRRIGLDGDRQLSDWLAQRADISLILGHRIPPSVGAKRVVLDPAGAGLDWNFEY